MNQYFYCPICREYFNAGPPAIAAPRCEEGHETPPRPVDPQAEMLNLLLNISRHTDRLSADGR